MADSPIGNDSIGNMSIKVESDPTWPDFEEAQVKQELMCSDYPMIMPVSGAGDSDAASDNEQGVNNYDISEDEESTKEEFIDNENLVDYPKHELPGGLCYKQTTASGPDAVGVFTTTFMPKNKWFGPYVGKSVEDISNSRFKMSKRGRGAASHGAADVLPPRGGRRAGVGAAAHGRSRVIAARGNGRGALGHDEPAIHGGTSSSSSSPAREEEVKAEAEFEVEDEAEPAAPQSKSKKRKTKTSYLVKADDETKLIEWIKGEEFLWNHLKSNYKNTQMKAARWEEKGQELGYTGNHLKGWWSQMRDMWTKIHQTKKRQAAKPLSDRAIYIQQNMHFLSRVVRHHAQSVRPIIPDPDTVPEVLEAAELDAMSEGKQHVAVADIDTPKAASQHPRLKKQRTASSTDDISELWQALHNSQDVLNKLVASQSAVPVSRSRREPFALYCYKAILNLPKDRYHNIKSQIFNILSNAMGDSDDEDSDVVATQPACEPPAVP